MKHFMVKNESHVSNTKSTSSFEKRWNVLLPDRDIYHTEYCVTPTSGKIAPKTRYFGWNIASLSQNGVSFLNVPPATS